MNHKSSKADRRIEAEVSSSESLNLLYFIHRNIDPKHCLLIQTTAEQVTMAEGCITVITGRERQSWVWIEA